MAVGLRIHMHSKNDYSLIVFLNHSGRANVTRDELLRLAREDVSSFPMDYTDVAAAFTGGITGTLLEPNDIHRALTAYDCYKDTLTYPPGYRESLLRARGLCKCNGSCSLTIEQA